MVKTDFLRAGNGRPLLLLHGFCESKEIWQDLTPLLSDHFTLLVPDLPGFGRSDALEEPLSIGQVAQSIWRWLDEMQIPSAVIAGHSLGGYVALAMASQRPENTEAVILFHSTAASDSQEKKDNRNKVIDFVNRVGLDPFLDTFIPSLFCQKDHPKMKLVDLICRKTKKETMLAYTAAMRDRPDLQGWLTQFGRPILFMAGENDTFITPESLEFQSKMAKRGTITRLPNVGHLGMFEDPAHSATVIRSFLSQAV